MQSIEGLRDLPADPLVQIRVDRMSARVRVAGRLHRQALGNSGLQEIGSESMSPVVESEPLDACQSTGSPVRSLEILELSKDQRIRIGAGAHTLQLRLQSRRQRNHLRPALVSVPAGDEQSAAHQIHIPPGQGLESAFPEAGVPGRDDQRPQVLSWRNADGQHPCLFVRGGDTVPALFLRFHDQWRAAEQRIPQKPSMPDGQEQDRPELLEFPVDRGRLSIEAVRPFNLFSGELESFQIAVGDRPDPPIAEVLLKRIEIPARLVRVGTPVLGEQFGEGHPLAVEDAWPALAELMLDLGDRFNGLALTVDSLFLRSPLTVRFPVRDANEHPAVPDMQIGNILFHSSAEIKLNSHGSPDPQRIQIVLHHLFEAE